MSPRVPSPRISSVRMTFIGMILSFELSKIKKRVEEASDAQQQHGDRQHQRHHSPGEERPDCTRANGDEKRSENRQTLKQIEKDRDRQNVRGDALQHSARQRRNA